VEIKISRRVHACSTAWRCRFLTARRSQHWFISTQVDREQKYGDFWRVCLTAEAQEREMKEINAAAEEARLLAEAIEAERLRVEEEARKAATAVYDDSPIVAKEYVSETREATFEDVAALDVVPERPLMQFQLSRPADSIGEPRVFADLSADNEMFTESRSTKNPDFALERREMSVSVQACKVKVDTGSQTWTRPIQASTQYHPVGNAYELPPPPPESKRERQASRQKLVNGKKGAVEEDTSLMTEEQLNERKKAAERDRSYAYLARFLAKTFAMMENALEQNETVDVFGDLFKGTGAGAEDLEASKGALGELKELRTFADINRTKGKHLHALQWHPSRKGVVAVGPRSNATFEERLQSYGFSSSSHVLYWDFADLITPLLVLEAPYSVEAFAINTERPHLVCGGLENGQVLVWDTSAATEAIDAKRQREKRRLAGESTREDEEASLFDDEARPPLESIAMASLGDHKVEHCHRRSVTQVVWLPRDGQIDYKGRLLDSEYQGEHSNQFVSISLDGQLLFWDLRFEDIARGKHPKIGRRMRGSTDVGPDGKLPQVPWQPLWRCHLAHPGGVGELGLCHMVNGFVGVNDDPVPSEEEDVPDVIPDHRCKFIACSEDGELLSGDWAATSEDDSEPAYVTWAAKDHPRPALALEQCALLRDHLLTCAERHFHIWLFGQKAPAFKSPRTAKLSCVAWSPTRAGVVFCGRSDGGLDIWDLCDDPERPIGSFRVASSAITSMSFQSDLLPGEYDQLLALGDEQGNLHVFDVPTPLRKAKANDIDAFRAFIQAEIDWEVKSQERMAAQKEAAESAKAAAPAEADAEEPAEEAEDTPKEGEFAFTEAELEADNAAYAKLQRKLAQEMDIRLLENGLRDWSYEPQPEQPAQ
jgi:WD40 repeat protein